MKILWLMLYMNMFLNDIQSEMLLLHESDSHEESSY